MVDYHKSGDFSFSNLLINSSMWNSNVYWSIIFTTLIIFVLKRRYVGKNAEYEEQTEHAEFVRYAEYDNYAECAEYAEYAENAKYPKYPKYAKYAKYPKYPK